VTLHLHRGTDTTVLADGLAELLAKPPEDPFAEELVVVPAKGVERWLTQRLSHRLGASHGDDGVCAGVRFLNPRSLVALLTGTERDDPWDPDRFVWPLLDVVDASLGEPWCATLARHLGHGTPGATDSLDDLRHDRRYAVARHLAGLFASYAVQRPQLLVDWQAGRDTDGAGAVLDDDLRWQPELWRRLLDARDVPAPAERHEAVRDRIRADVAGVGGAGLDLPDRLSMFGHTRMAVTELELLRAVGEVREVHLWLPQASPVAWSRLASQLTGPAQRETGGSVRRREDDSGRLVSHPLLASLGRDARELQRTLARLGPLEEHLHDPAEAPVPSLLGRLQEALRTDTSPDTSPGAAPAGAKDPADGSVQVHSCHSAARQVEVLREVLTGMLQDDETLEPRDILVMCPDVEAYAPLFSATFGLLDSVGEAGHPGHQLRVRLADRGLGSTNPMLETALVLVEFAGGRATASAVLDLLASDVVRRRFALDDDDVAELRAWVERSGVRWGLTQELRADFSMSGFGQNTWHAGLDRILLGAAMAEQGTLVGRRLPLDDVGSSGVDLAGRLAEAVDRLGATVARLREARTLRAWSETLTDGVLGLGQVAQREAWVQTEFERQLATILDEGGDAGERTTLRLADVRRLLLQHTQPRPTRANFRTGELTVATLVPMRSVPHRVVCLVGLDDGVFPRNAVADGDDVLLRDPLTGERDPRAEDRQLLLDAVTSAGDALVLTYTGRSIHTNEERPPAVPLGELLDALELASPGARSSVVTDHPLQPFDPTVFTAGAATSFDRAALEGARAVVGERHPPPPFIAAPLPERPDSAGTSTTLEDLHSYFASPVRGFLRQGLGVGLPAEHDAVEDRMPVALDNLQLWELGDRILRRAIAGDGYQAVCDAELTRGQLPPHQLGYAAITEVVGTAQALLQASAKDREPAPSTLDVTVDLLVDGARCRLTGVVPDVRGEQIVRVHFGSLSVKHRWRTWLDLLALRAAYPDRPWSAATYAWRKKPGLAMVSRLADVEAARTLLADVVALHRQGLREPLPIPPRTAHAFAEARRFDKSEYWPIRNEWQTRDNAVVPGESEAAEHVRVYGSGAPVEVLLTEALGRDPGPVAESSRLGRLACHMWNPVFAHEAVRKA
jgi:exodeoxyribonuclease V gamma subunit